MVLKITISMIGMIELVAIKTLIKEPNTKAMFCKTPIIAKLIAWLCFAKQNCALDEYNVVSKLAAIVMIEPAKKNTIS